MNWLQVNIKTSGLIISFVILFSLTMFGQQELVIKHRIKPIKQKSLRLNKEYTISTADSIYKRSKILNFTDTSMVIVKPWPFFDTIPLSFAEIQMIGKHWSVDPGTYEISGYLLIFSIFATGASVIHFATEEADQPARVGLFVGFLLAVPFTTCFAIDHIKINYDLKKKWEFAEKQDTCH